MISLAANFIFIHRGKSAGNTITDTLLPHSPDNIKSSTKPHQDGFERFGIHNASLQIRKHASIGEYKDLVDAQVFESLYKFSVIRNPFDRLVSAYFHPGRVMRQGDAFDEPTFIRIIQSQRTLREFTCLNTNDKLDTCLNRLIRYEHLAKDLEAVMQDLSLPFIFSKASQPFNPRALQQLLHPGHKIPCRKPLRRGT